MGNWGYNFDFFKFSMRSYSFKIHNSWSDGHLESENHRFSPWRSRWWRWLFFGWPDVVRDASDKMLSETGAFLRNWRLVWWWLISVLVGQAALRRIFCKYAIWWYCSLWTWNIIDRILSCTLQKKDISLWSMPTFDSCRSQTIVTGRYHLRISAYRFSPPGFRLHIESYIYIYIPIHIYIHQKFQVPKMEVLNLIRLFCGWVFPLHKPYPYSLL